MRSSLLLAIVMLLFWGTTGIGDAALYDRGGGLIYDSDLGITWLQDANYGAGSSYDNGVPTDGKMSWQNAMDWADALSYYDSVRDTYWNDWRLPTTPGSGTGNLNEGEMGHLYYDHNINASSMDVFSNVQSYHYWTDHTQTGDPGNAYAFGFNSSNGGSQRLYDKTATLNAWAVREGDVVPIPGAVWLLGSGVIGLVVVRRRFTK